MTLDYKKLILVMARTYTDAPFPSNNSIKRMEAALIALQNNMPEITLNLHEDLTLNEEKAKLWDKLKVLGRDNESNY